MNLRCHFHPEKSATYTDSIVDVKLSGLHANDIQYKRVPICFACYLERRQVSTSRIEPLELEGA